MSVQILKIMVVFYVSAMSGGSRGVVSEGAHRNGNEHVITMLD